MLPKLVKRVFGNFLIVVLFFASFPATASTHPLWFARNWQSDKGLPNNTIFTVAQTSDGYLWLGTSVGLVSFDGNRFRRYAFTNSAYQGNRGVFALLRGHGGGVWVGMDRGGVVYLDGDATKVFTQKDGLWDGQIRALAEEGDGTLWVVYLGSEFRQIKDGKATTPALEGLPADGFSSMTCDKSGRLWWAAGSNVWVHEDGKFLPKVQGNAHINCLSAAGKGGVWMAEARLHLVYCDSSGQQTDCGGFKTGQPDDAVSAMREDAAGGVWIGTTSGELFHYDGSKFERAAVLHPQIEDLTEDSERNLWVGTQGGGLYQVCRSIIKLTGIEDGPSVDMAASICADDKGNLWAVTENGLLARNSGDDWEIVRNKSWAREFLVCATADRKGTLWIGSRNRNLYRWSNGTVTEAPEAPNSIQAMVCSSEGDLWVGGLNFLEYLHEDTAKSISVPSGAHSIRAIAEDTKGNIWAGSSRGILLEVKDNEAKQISFPNLGTDSSIRCLMGASDGSIWIGHAGAGVGRVKDGHYARVGTEQGLYDDYISQIITDDLGWVWLGSDRGIFKVRREELEAVLDGRGDKVNSVVFGRDEGVANLQAVYGRSPEVAQSGDGRLWMLTHSGLAVMDPHLGRVTGAEPQVLIEKVILDGRVLAEYKNILPTWEKQGNETIDLRKPPSELRLPPDNRRLEIEFTTLSFSSLENIQFRYRLTDLDRDWLTTGTERSARYSRLSAGRYQFELQVRTAEGIWNAAKPALKFTVLPYFWQTGWFLAVVVILSLGLVAGSVRYFEKRRLRHQFAQLERERAVERERARIAKDIHDDLGASLTRIAMLSQSAMNKAEPAKQPTGELSRIYDTARSMTDTMDEIVWAINPSNDTLESLAAYFAEFVQEFLTPAGLLFRLDIPLALPRWNISSEVRHNLFLAFKEALNNVVKHSKATEVVVIIQVRDGGFVLSVEDNGSGFEPGSGRQGNGLINMRRRLEELHGRCIIESQPGRGTRVAFELELKM